MGGRFSRSCCAAALFAAALFTPAMAMAQSGAPPAQQAGIVALDCGQGGPTYNVWIDTDKSFATVGGKGVGWDGSFPVQITPTSIAWTVQQAPLTMEVIIDRTAGTIRWHYLPNPQGVSMNEIDSCARGSTPFPATRF